MTSYAKNTFKAAAILLTLSNSYSAFCAIKAPAPLITSVKAANETPDSALSGSKLAHAVVFGIGIGLVQGIEELSRRNKRSGAPGNGGNYSSSMYAQLTP